MVFTQMKILYFSQSSCGPCKTCGPLLKDVAGELGIEVHSYNPVEHYGAFVQHGVRGTPTTILLNGTNILDRSNLPMSRKQIMEFLDVTRFS